MKYAAPSTSNLFLAVLPVVPMPTFVDALEDIYPLVLVFQLSAKIIDEKMANDEAARII